MATTAITPTQLVLNTASADTDDQAGTVATTPADGWVIAAGGHGGNELWLKFVADASGDTVTILAGDRPPSHRTGLGNITVTLAASDVKYVAVEAAQVMQNDGTILATCTDAGTKCSAFIMPRTG